MSDNEELIENNAKEQIEKNENSSTDENSEKKEEWEDLVIKLDQLSIKDDDKDKLIESEQLQQPNKPKEKIRIGRGFNEKSHSVLKNDPVYNQPKSQYQDKSKSEDQKIEIDKLNIDTKPLPKSKDHEDSKPKDYDKGHQTQNKRTVGRPGERNIAVASRMLRNALGIKSPLSDKEKQHEKRLQELRKEKHKTSIKETEK